MCYDKNMNDQVSGKTKRSRSYGIRKADITLIAVCLLAAALLGVFFVVRRESGSEVRILCDGVELMKIDLLSASQTASSQADSDMATGNGYYLVTYRRDVAVVKQFANRPEPKLAEGTSYNLISVTDGMVVVEAADCKDQICVRHKPVSSRGESIICLPHRLVVEIVGDDTSGESLDGVVR